MSDLDTALKRAHRALGVARGGALANVLRDLVSAVEDVREADNWNNGEGIDADGDAHVFA